MGILKWIDLYAFFSNKIKVVVDKDSNKYTVTKFVQLFFSVQKILQKLM